MRLYNGLVRSSRRTPQAIALTVGDEQISYAACVEHVHQWLMLCAERGVRAGDRMAVISGNAAELAYLYFAASAAGITIIFLSDLPNATIAEWREVIAHADPQWIVFHPDLAAMLAQLDVPHDRCIALCAYRALPPAPRGVVAAARGPQQQSLVQLYTSGTTGAPKGVCISEDAVADAAANVQAGMGITAHSRVLLTGFLYNTTGLTVAIPTLLVGGTVIFPRSNELRHLLTQISTDRITHTMMTPYVLLHALAGVSEECVEPLVTLQCIAYGAAAMPPQLLARARRTLSCRFVQGYGLTESCGVVTWLGDIEHHNPAVAQSCGRASPFHDVCILNAAGHAVARGERGEVAIRGSTMMLGYWDPALHAPKPWKTHERDWLRTGDIGAIDDFGYVQLYGRSKDVVVNADGFTLYAAELERLALEAPGVVEAALLGWERDAESGEIPIVAVRTECAVSNDTWHALFADHLSAEKWPAYVVTIDTPFPRNRSGKILKPSLRRSILPLLAARDNAQHLIPISDRYPTLGGSYA